MGVTLVCLYPQNPIATAYTSVVPALLPVPQLDGHIISASQHQGFGGVNIDATDIITMSVELSHLE